MKRGEEMVYELTTLELRLWGAQKTIEGISTYTNEPQTKANLIGCWKVDVGMLFRMLVLREFDNVREV